VVVDMMAVGGAREDLGVVGVAHGGSGPGGLRRGGRY
jgi:hypothetical protein